MTLHEYRSRGSWEAYEESLLAQGWVPCWNSAVELRVAQGSTPCSECGQVPAYVGMRKGEQERSFAVCRCDRWSGLSPATAALAAAQRRWRAAHRADGRAGR
ncbi:MAG TPA: hypothetical protein VFW71_07255 [Actinomycetota bacterium]|nr:hypothetical protein [Actinomycetota bacterium]